MQRTAQPVDFDRQRPLGIVRPEVGRGCEYSPQECPGIVLAPEVLAHFASQRALGPVGDPFDRVDEVLALGRPTPPPP